MKPTVRWAAVGEPTNIWPAEIQSLGGTELCGIQDELFSLENIFAVMGNVQFADRIEQLIFNAFPGTCTADMWAHQHLQQAKSSVLVPSEARRPPGTRMGHVSNIYGFIPNFPAACPTCIRPGRAM